MLGWGWIIATIMANMVWAMPQFSLGTAAIQQNLIPGLNLPSWLCAAVLLAIGGVVIWCYDSGGKGVKIFDGILKSMVAVVVLSFFGVVAAMTFSEQGLPWGQIVSGFIPDFALLSNPADGFAEYLAESSDSAYWTDKIVATQHNIMIAAAATAVGINMTFLLPYSMLRKGWDKEFRGLATFDLGTGLFIPFLLATSCVVIASASQFHGVVDNAMLDAKPAGAYLANIEGFAAHRAGDAWATMDDAARADAVNGVPGADMRLASMLINRDAFALANSLENLTGKGVSQYVFGIGVLGMAISTIIILMLINGFALCELLNKPGDSKLHRIGCAAAGLSGAVGFLLLWSNAEAKFWLAVPTSVFGMVLLPIAYLTFLLMMNSKSLMGEHMLTGGKKIAANLVMLLALAAATFGAVGAIRSKGETIANTALGVVILMIVIGVVIHISRKSQSVPTMDNAGE